MASEIGILCLTADRMSADHPEQTSGPGTKRQILSTSGKSSVRRVPVERLARAAPPVAKVAKRRIWKIDQNAVRSFAALH